MITKKEFEEKYLEEREQISKQYNMDMGVATDILIAHVRNRNKELPLETKYIFKNCQNLNYEEIEKEVAEFDKIAAERRKELCI